MKLHRLDQLLSRCGYCSRGEAREWIQGGRILVDGVRAESANQKAGWTAVRVDGEPLDNPEGLLLVLHKPTGFVCSHDPSEGTNVYSLLPKRWKQRNPGLNTVGRLDRDTTGVLLITDIGPLIQQWTSPRRKVSKIYETEVDGLLKPELIEFFASGSLLLSGEDKPCAPARLEILGPHQARLELTEGRYHQVKRMFAAAGLQVTRLHRARFGEFDLQGLAPGDWRMAPPNLCP